MIDPQAVAVLYSIQDLEEDALGKVILTHILAALRDVVKQVPFRAIL